ncbi:MAG TPA: sugar-binding protein [Candidatus Acidoferrales bacterium]|nr:sugar-binding protein [Candidatus Acidoferrales bacterium]
MELASRYRALLSRFFMTGVALLACGAAARAASGQDAFTITVPKLDAPPSMNGVIDDTWAKAVQIPVTYDFTYQRPGEQTIAYIAQDATALDVAFVATQKAPLTANQETNGSGVMSDDSVGIVLYPQGTQGFQYQFVANPLGARDQTSSENSSYAPQWTAVAKKTATGYVVTMRIPFNIIRSGHSQDWRAQMYRMVMATNSMDVWSHAPGQRQATDATFAGTFHGIAVAADASALRPKPRLQIYGLGELTTPANGGNTSRIGADMALPVTATSSLLATVHPDYSNLETDQQTIAPTAYARQYAEVRPFFTQATANYNYNFSCTNCPTTLYTPAIPTFSDGYAYEGTQGPLNFGAFNAAGPGRSDAGEALNYNVSNPNDIYGVNVQNIAVNAPGLHDVTTTQESGYGNQHTHFFVYFNSGSDRGTNVTDPGLGDYFEYGGGYVTQLITEGFTFQKIGEQFDPVDGYVAQTDIAGYSDFLKRTFNFAADAPLRDMTFKFFYGRFNNHEGQIAQTDGTAQVNLDLRNLLSLQLFTSTSGVRTTYSDEFLPYDTNGFQVGYKTATTTPTTITYNGGLYQHGHLTSWSYVTTQPVLHSVNLSLEADESLYAPGIDSTDPVAQQWLERSSLDWQFSRDASVVIGARRIIGRNLPNSFQASDVTTVAPCGTPNGENPFDCVNAGNVSFAFHLLHARDEYYVVYGNPNSLATTPALYVKWIRYIGAEKGT